MEAWGSSYFLMAAAYGLKRDIVQVESKALGRCQLSIYRKEVARNQLNNIVSYQFLSCKEKEIFNYVDANAVFIVFNGTNHYKALIEDIALPKQTDTRIFQIFEKSKKTSE